MIKKEFLAITKDSKLRNKELSLAESHLQK